MKFLESAIIKPLVDQNRTSIGGNLRRHRFYFIENFKQQNRWFLIRRFNAIYPKNP
jgi:hypothetical protein